MITAVVMHLRLSKAMIVGVQTTPPATPSAHQSARLAAPALTQSSVVARPMATLDTLPFLATPFPVQWEHHRRRRHLVLASHRLVRHRLLIVPARAAKPARLIHHRAHRRLRLPRQQSLLPLRAVAR